MLRTYTTSGFLTFLAKNIKLKFVNLYIHLEVRNRISFSVLKYYFCFLQRLRESLILLDSKLTQPTIVKNK